MHIKFTGAASPRKTQAKLKREVAEILNAGRDQHYTPDWTAIDVTEGAEKCGYGALIIKGIVQHWNGYTTVTYELENQGSRWRNYGAPHGTIYDVEIELKQL